jgi:S1-C subfamily serine protease
MMDADKNGTGGTAPKLLGTLRLKVRLAGAAIAVLVAGALLAPRAAPTAVPASQERPAPLLEQEVQRREPVRLFRPVQEIARQIIVHNVTIPPPLHSYPRSMADVAGAASGSVSPAGFGVFVDASGTVLTHTSALLGQPSLRVLTADGASVQAELVAHEASTGLVLLQTAGLGTVVPAPIESTRAEAGALAATAAQWLDRSIVAPVFVTSAGLEAYAIDAHGAALAGMALYNLDGQAFAIATGSARGTAFPAREAVDRLLARRNSGKPIDAAFGMTFQAVTGPLTGVFHEKGALVTYVIPNGPAAHAGIVHGDVVTSISSTSVDSPEAVQKIISTLAPGSTTNVEITRGTRSLTVSVTAGSAFDLSRPSLRPRPEGGTYVAARDLLSPMEIEAAAIAGDAAVLEINGVLVASRDTALREWRRPRFPKTLYLEQDGARFFAVIDAPK